ncbi:DUF6415 family natural product biosynthesis protein [Streptomyces sp. URMC 127]|uniref:DUF6415 family natural product biosynthesis protein n=1 Tax=Streptomyces sp. URMC 127 TaxID=3423402 RepID=UPI003F1DC6CF
MKNWRTQAGGSAMWALKTFVRPPRGARRPAARGKQNEYPIDVDDIMNTVRAALDRLPLAATVDHQLLRLRGHIQLLLSEIEIQDWARYGQEDQIRLMAASVRDTLAEVPEPGPAVGRCVYAKVLAGLCRDLLSLALIGETVEVVRP